MAHVYIYKIPLVKLQQWPISVQPKQKSIFILPHYALDWQSLLAVMVSHHRSNWSNPVIPKRNAAGSPWYYNTPYHISRRGWWLSLFIRHAAPRHRPTQQQRQVDDGNNNNNKELYRIEICRHTRVNTWNKKKRGPCVCLYTRILNTL